MKKNDLDYQKSLDFIYSFIDHSIKRNLRNAADKFKLERMVHFMRLLDDPHKKYKIIHVAGTKGKGSVSAFCASVLKAAGYNVGLYTSPHMEEFSERIRVNNEEITRREFVQLVEKIKPLVDQVPEITTFELTTALGFLYFAEKAVDVAVVEVGLGGRLDATNIVDPLISVITSISYDHTQILGNKLSKIAYEKGGIIKPGRPVVVAPQKDEVFKKLEELSIERSAPLIRVGKDFLFAADNHSLDGQNMFVWTPEEQPLVDDYIESGGMEDWTPLRIKIPLLGYHQVVNAATAYAALMTTNKIGLKINSEVIVRGFAQTHWPGRFDLLRRQPPVIIDCAHNRDSALKLRLAVDDYFPGLPMILVFGASADKDIGGMFDELLPRSSKVITTQSIHPRAIDAKELLELVHQRGYSAQAVVPIEEALKVALKEAGDEAIIIITGSIFVAAAARAVWSILIE